MWLSSRDRTRVGAAASAVALAWAASPACAQDWQANPKVELGYLYDNNYRLTPPGTENEVSGGVIQAELELASLGQITEFRLVPRIRSTQFPDDPEEESDDYFARLDWEHHSQRMRTAVGADYAQQTVATSEQPSSDIDTGLGETGGADAGIVAIRNRRELIRVRPTLSYEFTPRRRLDLAASAADVSFDRDIPGAQTAYRDYGLNVGFAFATSPRSVVTVRALASRYDVDIEANSADAYGLELEWSTSASETVEAFMRGGAQRTNFNDNPITGAPGEEVTSWLAGVGLRRSVKLTELFFDATHSVGPNASGFVVQRDQLRFRTTHLFSPRFSMFGGVRGTHDEAIANERLFRPRSYATADLGAEWRIWQQLSVVVSVDYTWQDFESSPLSNSESGGGRLSFVYEPRRRD